MSRTCSLLVALLALLPLAATSQAEEQDLRTIVKQGKAATALVQTESHHSGTAFCVNPDGWFVTNQHVVGNAQAGDSTTLILNAAEDNERVVKATILRVDKEADLALLQAEGEDFPSLPLGKDDDLFETNQITAFGFPFGRLLAKREEYPGVTVSAGRITALRKREGKLETIQLDNSLHPGNSGGAVVDASGKVIGIVRAGVRGTRVNVAIPVSHLTRLIETPVVRFETESINEAAGRREKAFPIQVSSLIKPPADRRVGLELQIGEDKPRRFEAKRDEEGIYQVKAALLPAPADARLLRVAIEFDGGSLAGSTADVPVTIGERTIRLSEIHRIERGEEGQQKIILDGEVLHGKVAAPKKARIDLGGLTTRLDISKAKKVTISLVEQQPPKVSYRVIVRDGEKVVAEAEGRIAITVNHTEVATADPPTERVKVTPPRLDEGKTIIKLPAPIDDVVVGAGGKLLIFHIKKLQQLAVFDVSQAKVVKYLTLASNDISYAAGREKLFVGLRDSRVIQRYDLATFEREITVDAPEGGIGTMAMGAEALTPLILLASRDAKKSYVIDTKSMQAERHGWQGWKGGAWGPVHVHVSLDGSTVVVCGGGWAGTEVASLAGGKIVSSKTGGYVMGQTLIAGNGSLVFPNKGGIRRQDQASNVQGIEGTPFPAISTAYSLAYSNRANKAELIVFGNSDPKRLITIRDLPELNEGSSLPIYQRVLLIPRAEVLITVGKGSDHLILRPFNLEEELQEQEIDYLFVASAPQRVARRGTKYEYPIKVRSRNGGVKFSLQAGPEGMKVSPAGQLTWNVAADYLGEESPVIVQISDKSGQQTFHTFRLTIE